MIAEHSPVIEDLRRRWRERPLFSLFRPLYPAVSFAKDWLVLGDSTPLARITDGSLGEPELAFKGGEKRVLTLLALAYMRPTPTRTLDHMRRAARDWARGEKCRAYIHLAFARLTRLEEPEEAAFRLFMADGLMGQGARASDLLKAFGLYVEPIDRLEKFNPDQPRVPKGSGRESGEWTGGGGGVPPARAPALADDSTQAVGPANDNNPGRCVGRAIAVNHWGVITCQYYCPDGTTFTNDWGVSINGQLLCSMLPMAGG